MANFVIRNQLLVCYTGSLAPLTWLGECFPIQVSDKIHM